MSHPSPDLSRASVLFVTSSLGAGGAERVLTGMANALYADCQRVGILTLASSDDDHYSLEPGIERIALDLQAPSTSLTTALATGLRRQRALRREMLAYEPDAVISFIDKTNVRVLVGLIGTRIPAIISERTDPSMHIIPRLWRIARQMVYRRAAHLVVQTQAVADWAEAFVPKHRITVVPNATPALPEPTPIERREKLITAMGRLEPSKAFDVLIDAFAQGAAAARGWRLCILGEGSERQPLEQRLARLGIEDQVEFPGVTRNPWAYLNRSQIFVQTSRYEGFPNALLEAMGMGCICIATRCPSGPTEIVNHGANGILVDVDDLDGIAAAIDDCTAMPASYFTMARAALRVREDFAQDKVLGVWRDLIAKLVDPNATA